MAAKTGGRRLSEEEIYTPDLDEGKQDVDHYPIPEYQGNDDYLSSVWSEALALIEHGEISIHHTSPNNAAFAFDPGEKRDASGQWMVGGKKPKSDKAMARKAARGGRVARIFERGDAIRAGHHKNMLALLSKLRSGDYAPEDVLSDVEHYHDRAVRAEVVNHKHRYLMLKKKFADAYGEDKLKSPEWGKVVESFKKSIESVSYKLEQMSDMVRISARAWMRGDKNLKGIASELAGYTDDHRDEHTKRAHARADAIEAFQKAHQVLQGKALSIEDERNTNPVKTTTRADLIAEILVLLFGDDAEGVADNLAEDDDLQAAFATGSTPVLTRRYGKRPGPNWVSGGVSAKGKQVWLWTPPSSSGTPSPAPPPPAAPTPPPPQATPPVVPPVPTPKPAAAVMPPFPNTKAPPGQKRPSNSAVAAGTHAAAIARLQAGATLSQAEKAILANRLNMMSLTQLRSLHTALGGPAALTDKKLVIASVKGILAGTTPTLATPTPAPTPAALKPKQPTAAMQALPANLHAPAAEIRAIALAYKDGLIPLTDADDSISEIEKNVRHLGYRRLLIDALTSKTGLVQLDDVIDAIHTNDPGHIGPSPPGLPPRHGLVWDATTHRWVLPPQPKPSSLKPGRNAITGAKPAPSYYQPPPPVLPKVGPYADGASVQSGLPRNIDHTTVSSFSQDITALPGGFKYKKSPVYTNIGVIEHSASGYQILLTWKNSVPSAGGSADYRIDVMDGAGQIVSTYDSYAARDKTYIEGRASQVAHWLDAELTKQAKQAKGQATSTNVLAQFAHEYAVAAGIKPGAKPFDLDDSAANRTKMEAHLRTAFPKLVGSQQHPPHGGMDVVEHTMNIVNPANLRTAGLSQRDAELLRLGMLYHDVGKQHDPLDHDHPRKSAVDAEPLLWQFGLTPREVSDTLAIIKWHDAYGDAMKAGGGPKETAKLAKLAYEYTDVLLPPDKRRDAALRINNLLMRAYQSDVSSIPGLTSKPIPGRPDLKPYGFIDVDTTGPTFEAKVAADIKAMFDSGAKPSAFSVPKKPANVQVGTEPPDLVAPGKKWGELVQRTEELPIGTPVPYHVGKVPPQEVYDEARKNPDLNYARAFNMAYDGPTGMITTCYHGTDDKYAPGILTTGIRAGNKGNNVFGHGVYTVVNGADSVPSGYTNGAVVQMEVHTGRVISHDDLIQNIAPKFQKANPALYNKLYNSNNNGWVTAAALWAGYSTIAVNYSHGNPTLVVLDPSRIRLKQITNDRRGPNGYKGMSVNTPHGTVTSKQLSADERSTPKGHADYMPVKNGVPQGWAGTPKTK